MNKNFIVFFAAVLLVFYLAFNWSHISWIFNYREVTGLTEDFFNPYPESNFLANAGNPAAANNPPKIDNSLNEDYSPKHSLLAPSIGLLTPVVIANSTDKKG